MPKIPLRFAISSLSCAPANIFKPQDIVFPTLATTLMITRLIAFRQALSEFIPLQEISVSFHDGYMFDSMLAIEGFTKNNIPISSIDTPDVRSILAFGKRLGENIFQGSIPGILESIGWQLASVTNVSNYISKVDSGLKALSKDDSTHFVRTFAGCWNGSPVGELLIDKIKKERQNNTSLALAIEIDAVNQSPDDYYSLIKNLQSKHPDLPIYADLDIGHMAESLKYHKTFSNENLTALLTDIFEDSEKNRLIGLVSLNQYDHIKQNIHIEMMKGSIDYLNVMRIFGEAARREAFSEIPTVLIEFRPMVYETMISNRGMDYLKSLIKAFDGTV